jgi:hypothetical protein
MTDSTAIESEVPAEAKQAGPLGYTQDGPRSATFDASRFGYGTLTFAEPLYGRFKAFQRAQFQGDEDAEALMLRAFVKRASGTGFPKTDAPLKAWADFVANEPLSSVAAVLSAASYFSDVLAKDVNPAGNG